jgi:hypothetical protein
MNATTFSPGLVTSYSYYSLPISGRVTVPVQPSQSLYAQFEYVQGVATAEGGLSLDRLKVIDSLLAQINAHQQAGTPKLTRRDVDLERPDQAIAQLSAEAAKMQKDATAFQPWGNVKGLVFSVRA